MEELVFFVRAFHPTHTWKPDESFLTPKAALLRAQTLSVQLQCIAAVSCDARDWVQYNNGAFYLAREWSELYTGEPTESYKALKEALNEEMG